MGDLHLCLFSPPPSLCLSACVKQCLLCILASHSRQMERWLLFRSWQGCFSGCHPTVCSFTPFSLCLAWEKVVRLCHIRGHHFYDGTFRPFSRRLGISSPQASLTGQCFPFKDVAPFLYSLPFFSSQSHHRRARGSKLSDRHRLRCWSPV